MHRVGRRLAHSMHFYPGDEFQVQVEFFFGGHPKPPSFLNTSGLHFFECKPENAKRLCAAETLKKQPCSAPPVRGLSRVEYNFTRLHFHLDGRFQVNM